MLDPESPELRLAVFGQHVENFLESEVGKYLLQCAKSDVEEALEKLKDVDAEDPKAIRDLQFKIRVADGIISYLGDAVRSGRQAREGITGNQENEDYQ